MFVCLFGPCVAYSRSERSYKLNLTEGEKNCLDRSFAQLVSSFQLPYTGQGLRFSAERLRFNSMHEAKVVKSFLLSGHLIKEDLENVHSKQTELLFKSAIAQNCCCCFFPSGGLFEKKVGLAESSPLKESMALKRAWGSQGMVK